MIFGNQPVKMQARSIIAHMLLRIGNSFPDTGSCFRPILKRAITINALEMLTVSQQHRRINTIGAGARHQANNKYFCHYPRHAPLLFYPTAAYSDPMSSRNRDPNYGSTEDVPQAAQHIDKLAPLAALSLMLDSQAGAIPAIEAALPAIETAAIAAYDRLVSDPAGRLIYVGAGTSARIGVQDGAELPPTFNWPRDRLGFLIAGGPSALLGAIENAEDDASAGATGFTAMNGGAHDVVIGIAASGKTPFTIGAITAARKAGAVTIGIANNPDTPLLAAAHYPILLATGGEIIAGSTRLTAGTAQKICMNLISNMIMVKMGFVANGMMVAMVPTNEKLRQRRAQIDAALGQ